MHPLKELVKAQKNGKPYGIYSICSANEYVIKAAIAQAKKDESPVLIEATANQVNQYGGYTGMTPTDFAAFVHGIARDMDFPQDRIILGGDHLGPLTWVHLPEAEAMAEAKALVKSYALAGFTKIHLDTSMKLADDAAGALAVTTVAKRAAALAEICEQVVTKDIVYIVGSEVPIPGGATEQEDSVEVTSVADFENAVETFKQALLEKELSAAWEKVVGFVVQPGVEFGSDDIIDYDRAKAKELTAALTKYPNLLFEGHSTDYQTTKHLKEMVEDGIAILKVGPGLTFALREALLSLEKIEQEMLGGQEAQLESVGESRHNAHLLEANESQDNLALSDLSNVLENIMRSKPANWEKHYHGDARALRLQRKYSLSDRIRYYLADEAVQSSIKILVQNLDEIVDEIPLGLIRQYMPHIYRQLRNQEIGRNIEEWIIASVADAIEPYAIACASAK